MVLNMLQASQVNFGYGRDSLFTGTDLTVAPGHVYGLLGLNGAGKSTLLKLMTGLLFPDSGRITACGHDPARRAPGFLSRVFMLPEELNVPGITGKEFVAVRSPFYPGFDRCRMQRYFDEFEIPDSRKLTALSHGQQKKFLLSFGLACDASLVLLDEPTNGLDIPSKGLFRRLVAEALTEERTVIVSTHQVRDVESLVDRVVILHEGKVLLHRGVPELSTNLRFSVGVKRPEASDGLIYSERAVGGYASVSKCPGGDEGRLDLELLFKAVIAEPAAFAAWPTTEEPT